MKRSPINRGTKRLLRKVRLAVIGKRKKREAGALATFKKAVLRRSLGRCELCGAAKATDAHHICSQARGVGHPMLHDERNGFAVCRPCHDKIHSTPGHPWIETVHWLDNIQAIDSRNRS